MTKTRPGGTNPVALIVVGLFLVVVNLSAMAYNLSRLSADADPVHLPLLVVHVLGLIAGLFVAMAGYRRRAALAGSRQGDAAPAQKPADG